MSYLKIKYDWRQFTGSSDKRYRDARFSGNLEPLKNHNIMTDGEVEIRFIRDVLQAFSKRDLSGKTALDVCCGTGHMSNCLSNIGMSVVGFDLNADAIALAGKTNSKIQFFVDDAVNPSSQIIGQTYDLVLIREAHPFSRIDDFPFQKDILNLYLSLLNPHGALIIAHARRGGGMFYPSVSFDGVDEYLICRNYKIIGPFYMFIYKHFGLKAPGRILLWMQSLASSLLARLFRLRWIEFFFVVCR